MEKNEINSKINKNQIDLSSKETLKKNKSDKTIRKRLSVWCSPFYCLEEPEIKLIFKFLLDFAL